MRKYILLVFLTLQVLSSALYAQTAPSIEWQKSLGGSIDETSNSVEETFDGGFVIAGYSKSLNGDVTGNHGYTDYWVVKLDSFSDIVWEKSLGGSDYDVEWGLDKTSDGGFILVGQSKSSDGDVSGNHGNTDYWIVKLDMNGNLVWQKSLGGSDFDEAYSVDQTSDGGFIVAGNSESSDGDVTGNHGEYDYWMVRLDPEGNLLWEKSLGGSEEDEAYSVQETADGGFIVAGESESTDGDVSAGHGEADAWVIKLDASGNIIWEKCYGGSGYDEAFAIQQTFDGGYIIAARSASNDGDVSGNNGETDFWILKIDGEGNLIWQNSYGGSAYDWANSVAQTEDGGFIVAGHSYSNDGDVTGNHGLTDFWVVRLDANGNLEWQKSLGGSGYDQPYCVRQASDGGYVVTGLSFSNDGDVTGNHGSEDCWVVKLNAENASGINEPSYDVISLFPNPVKDVLIVRQSLQHGGIKNISPLVYDLHGSAMELPVTISGSEFEINTSNLLPGFYTLRITETATGKTEIKKFIKVD